METRFTVKDFVLILMMVVVIVLVGLSMIQFDRQWEQVRAIRAKLDDHSIELRDIQRRLQSGLVVTGGGIGVGIDPVGDDPLDPFRRMRAARQKPNFAEGDWLVSAFSGGVAKLTPLVSGDANAAEVQSYVLESLATRDPETLEWRPLLSTGWTISDDGLRITFKMRPGVRFSDGVPLTADDVVFSYEFIMNPAIAAPRARAYYSKIARVEKTAEDEVTFIYEEPYFLAFELAAGMDIMPKHFYGKFEPEQFNQSLGLLLGSGPYRLEDPESWRPGRLIQLVRNERYWGVPPAFDRLVYREITHDIARMQAFRNGDTDQFGATPEQYIDMIRDQNLLARTHQFEYQNPIGGYRYIAWNQRQGDQPTFFADRRVRQALTMLLDRQRLIEEVMLGYAVPATGPFNPLSKQFNPEVQPWPFDVARAEALLAEAGFTRGRDGVLRNPQGRPFRFKLTYPSGSANYERMVLLVKDSFARAGIVVDPDPLEWAVFTDRLNNRNFDAITLGWTSGIETDIYQMFHSSQIADQGDNFISYHSPELDSLIEQARRTVREDQRMPLWQRAHAVLNEDQPYTFLFFGKTLRFIDKRIHNIEQVKLGLNPTVEWFVPRDQQRWTR